MKKYIYICLLIVTSLREPEALGVSETTISSGSNPGGDCAVALNKRCCENDGVWRQKQVFHCQCNTGFSAGTTKGLPSCVKNTIKSNRLWCDMDPCLEGESCNLYIGPEGKIEGWQCINGSDAKTTKIAD